MEKYGDPHWTYLCNNRKIMVPTEWKSPPDAPKVWNDPDSLYYHIVTESEGFDSFLDPSSDICGAIRPMSISKWVIKATDFAFEEYNKQGGNLKLKKIIKANWQLVSGCLYYITLEATDGKEDNFYEVKVFEEREGMTLDMFRPAIHYKV